MIKKISLKAAIIPAMMLALIFVKNASSQTYDQSSGGITFSISAIFGSDGYNSYGYDRYGYDRNGYDRNGYCRDGYNRDGYNRQGYDRDGRYYDRDRYEGKRIIVYEDDSHMRYRDKDDYKYDRKVYKGRGKHKGWK